jgi:hypothetical protein
VRPSSPAPRYLAFSTTCFTVFDVLPPKWTSPPYTAVTVVVPFLSVEVVKLADPPLNVPVPNIVFPFVYLPSINLTVSPSGGAPRPEVTTAVKVTASPEVDGFGADVRVVVVAAAGVSKSNTVP